jgi:hypothetical protein
MWINLRSGGEGGHRTTQRLLQLDAKLEWAPLGLKNLWEGQLLQRAQGQTELLGVALHCSSATNCQNVFAQTATGNDCKQMHAS